MTPHADCRTPLAARRSFTLTELMVAIGIIALIATITAVSVRAVARDMKLSSATNSVVAALDNARAIAMRENTLVAVVFRARLDGDNRQYIEVVTAKWTRQTPTITVVNPLATRAIDRFTPVPGIAVRRLPAGIAIAAPLYHSQTDGTVPWDNSKTWDETWGFMSFLPTTAPGNEPTREAPGRVFGVLYAPNGSVVTRNNISDAYRMYVDINDDGVQQLSMCTSCDPSGEVDYNDPPTNVPNFDLRVEWMFQKAPLDEPLITTVPFFAVYDEEQFRDQYDPSDWFGTADLAWHNKHRDVTEFVNEHANRIHFNRYTGVVMQ